MIPVIRFLIIASLSLIPTIQNLYNAEPKNEQLLITESVIDFESDIKNVDSLNSSAPDIKEKNDDFNGDRANIPRDKQRDKQKKHTLSKYAYVALPVSVVIGGFFIIPRIKEALDEVGNQNEYNCQWLMTNGKKICTKKTQDTQNKATLSSRNKPSFNIIVVKYDPQDKFFDTLVSGIGKDDKFKKMCAIQNWTFDRMKGFGNDIYNMESATIEFNPSNSGTFINVTTPIYDSTLEIFTKIFNHEREGVENFIQHLARLYASTLYMAKSKNINVVILREPNIIINDKIPLYKHELILTNPLKNVLYGRYVALYALAHQIFYNAVDDTKCKVIFLCDSFHMHEESDDWDKLGTKIMQKFNGDINLGKVLASDVNNNLDTIKQMISLELESK